MSTEPRSIYIANGRASRERVESFLVSPAEDVLVTHTDDMLSVGPLMREVAEGPWLSLRRAYAAEAFGDAAPEHFWLPPEVIEERCSPTFWMGAGTPDHIALTWLYQLLAHGARNRDRLRVVQYRVPSRIGPSQAIGLLGAELKHKPEVVEADAEHEYLEEAWRALTSESPTDLERFVTRPSPQSFPLFGDALAERLRQYPSAETGLPAWDALLLQNVAAFPERLALAMGHTLADIFERLDYVGDNWLLGRLRSMAKQPSPLVTLVGNAHSLRDCSAQPTEAGRAVLAGEVNALDIRPCDAWIGGVRPDTGTGSVWCLEADGVLRLRQGRGDYSRRA